MPDGAHTLESSVLDRAAFEMASDRPKTLARRRKRLFAGLAAVVLAGALAGGAAFVLGGHTVTTDNAYVGAPSAAINSQVAGAVAEVRVDDAQMVHKGDILVRIDPADTALAVAKADADYRHTLQRVQQYYAQQAALTAQVAARQADLDLAGENYTRRRGLAATGDISQEALTTARTAYESAKANLAAAQQSLEAQRILTRDTTPASHPETVAAKAALDAALLDQERTVIRAPIDGVVSQRRVQLGERVQPGEALMTVTPLSETYVDANFKENQLSGVHAGQPVTLVSDLYGDKVVFHGRVAGLGGGTGSAFAAIPAQNATGNWIKVVQRLPVRIALDPQELAAHPLRVGLSMTATVDLRTQP
jgi:membrane fusion protein (multidrug efflux system)